MTDPALSDDQALIELERACTLTLGFGLTVVRSQTEKPPEFIPFEAVTLKAVLDIEDRETQYPDHDFYWSIGSTSKARLVTTVGETVDIEGLTKSDPKEVELTCVFAPSEAAAANPSSLPPLHRLWKPLKLTVSRFWHSDVDLYSAIRRLSGDLCGKHMFGLRLPQEWKVSPPAAAGADGRWADAIRNFLAFNAALTQNQRNANLAAIDGIWAQLEKGVYSPALDISGVGDHLTDDERLIPRAALTAGTATWEAYSGQVQALQGAGLPAGFSGGYYHLGLKWLQLAGLYVHALVSSLKRDKVTVTWDRVNAEDPMQDCSLTPNGDSTVRLLRYKKGGSVKLTTTIQVNVEERFPFQALSVTASVKHRDREASYDVPGSVSFQGTSATLSLQVDPMLRALNTGPNVNLLEARVSLAFAGLPELLATEPAQRPRSQLLHLMVQKMILFLPGVLGSKVRVSGENPGDWNWPAKVIGTGRFAHLRCRDTGLAENDAVELAVMTDFGIYTEDVYQEELRNLERFPGHPTLWRNRRRVQHYFYRGAPYDWRLSLQTTVDALLSQTHAQSIKVHVRLARLDYPFVDDKVCIAGHSTGGVIMKRLLAQDGARNLIDWAFFVNAPFLGAPKAYYAYLTGMMLEAYKQWAVFDREVFRRLAPNMPIVYHLAPTDAYPGTVFRIVNGPFPEGLADDDRTALTAISGAARNTAHYTGAAGVGALMKPLARLAALVDIVSDGNNEEYPLAQVGALWNDALATQAKTYHAVGGPAIDSARCVVFYSNCGPTSTLGGLEYDGDDPTGAELRPYKISGDGTVPLQSLMGYPVSDKVDIGALNASAERDHVKAPNQPEVWRTMLDRLVPTVIAVPTA